MAFLIIFTFLSFIFFAFPQPANAIIILPAVILIPIVKIVALIIGTLSLPTATIGAIWSKLFKISLKRTLGIIVLALIVLAIVLTLILKWFFPTHPLL